MNLGEIKSGDVVTIPRGTVVYGVNTPRKRSTRNQVVKVHRVSQGCRVPVADMLYDIQRYCQDGGAHYLEINNMTLSELRDLARNDHNAMVWRILPHIVWAGSGGYWRYAELS